MTASTYSNLSFFTFFKVETRVEDYEDQEMRKSVEVWQRQNMRSIQEDETEDNKSRKSNNSLKKKNSIAKKSVDKRLYEMS